MIIKRKTARQTEVPREEIVEVQQVDEDLSVESLSPIEPSADELDFEIPPVEYSEVKEQEAPQKPVAPTQDDEIDLFNLDNIDFRQRQERRRGDRRRGFRRVDDRNLISRAREEADSIREAASKEGYQEGLKKAVDDIAEIKSALLAFQNAPQEVFEYIAPEILEISVEIAQKIIKTEVTQNPQVVLDKITEILKTLSKEEPKVTIRVNPLQVSIAKQGMGEVLESAGLDTKIVVLPDETVTEGGCIVTTNNGVIDATIESQIAIIKEALKEV